MRWRAPSAPATSKEATDDGARDGSADVQRYEQLRRSALGEQTGECRHGLALLQRRGLAAWARAWPEEPRPGRPALQPVERAAASDGELVGALATLALARLAA